MKRKYKSLVLIVIMFVIILLTFTGCFSASRESALMKEAGIDVSTTEFKIRLKEFGYRFAGVVELSADEIISKTTDAEIKKNALLWKINAIPAMIRSLAINDPLAAGADAWILSAQMLQYFEEGYGKDLFGDYQNIAITASKLIVADFENVAKGLKREEDISRGQQEVYNWVKKHPIKNHRFIRVSALDEVAQIIGSENYDIGTTVGNIAISVDELKNQVTLYTDLLPKQIQWQAQYFGYELLGDSITTDIKSNFNSITESINRITKVLEESPDLFKELQLSTLKEIQNERVAILDAVTQERIAVLTAISLERISLMDEINRERKETLDRIEKITNKTIDRSAMFASETIDKLFWRIIILLGIIFTGGFILLMYYKKKS